MIKNLLRIAHDLLESQVKFSNIEISNSQPNLLEQYVKSDEMVLKNSINYKIQGRFCIYYLTKLKNKINEKLNQNFESYKEICLNPFQIYVTLKEEKVWKSFKI